MAKASYHHIPGMSFTEREELMTYLKNRFVWSGKTFDIRVIRAMLYYRETFKKMRALGEFLETHMQNRKFGSEGFKIQNMHFKFYFTYSRDLVDKSFQGGRKNKSTTLRILDEWMYGIARSFYPNDPRVEEAITRNHERWISLKMPSMQRKRPGPKPGSHRKETK